MIPQCLEPVQAFITDTDWLSGATALATWLFDQGLVSAPTRVTQVEFQLALVLRSGLRILTLANNGGPSDPDTLAPVDWALSQFPLTAQASARPGDVLVPKLNPPAMAGLGQIVAGYAIAAANGDWHRLRRCPAEGCTKIFWDSSAKGTRRWCDMQTCGNRSKVRAFSARQAKTAA